MKEFEFQNKTKNPATEAPRSFKTTYELIKLLMSPEIARPANATLRPGDHQNSQ